MVVLVGGVGRVMRMRGMPLGMPVLIAAVIGMHAVMRAMVMMIVMGVVTVGVAPAGRAAGAVLAAGQQRLVHDLADRPGAAAALGAAAEAAIDLAGQPRAALRHHVANLAIRQDIAGTNDHGGRDFPCRRSMNASAILK